MLQDARAAEMVEIEAIGDGIFGVGPHGLREEKDGITFGNVEAIQHGVLEFAQGDFLAIPGEIPMVGQGVEARARSASYLVMTAGKPSDRCEGRDFLNNNTYSLRRRGLSILGESRPREAP